MCSSTTAFHRQALSVELAYKKFPRVHFWHILSRKDLPLWRWLDWNVGSAAKLVRAPHFQSLYACAGLKMPPVFRSSKPTYSCWKVCSWALGMRLNCCQTLCAFIFGIRVYLSIQIDRISARVNCINNLLIFGFQRNSQIMALTMTPLSRCQIVCPLRT